MPTFNASLFLPYTIDFYDLPSRSEPSASKTWSEAKRVDTSRTLLNNPPSLFPRALTPPTKLDGGQFFAQAAPTPAASSCNAPNPGALVRSESLPLEWCSGQSFHQPESRARELPIPQLVGHYPIEVEEGDPVHVPKRRPRGLSTAARTASLEWTVEPTEQGNGGLTNAVRAAIRAGTLDENIWIGTVGFPTDALDDHTKEEISGKLESEHDSIMVEVSDSDLDGHYNHYCKTILWPIIHYQIPDHPKSKAYLDHSWIFYVKVNEAFADKIVKRYKRGDIIWIHDYHLLLVPAMIRKQIPDAQVGLFFHSAFPSSEVFRCLSVRNQLLEGMLGANLIAFQTAEYQEHFVATCSRLLAVEATPDGIQLDDRLVSVASHPIGIDPKALDLAREDPSVKHWIKVCQERYNGKRLIIARDKLDHIRGVRQKLLAFELFLTKYPEWREHVVLVQIAMSAGEDRELSSAVSNIVTRIDSQHSTLSHQPLVFLRQDISFSQYISLLCVADILMVTSLREGMNLSSHEWIVCQDGKMSEQKHGPVILSEFTGSASVFKGAELSINPWNYQGTADAINIALAMEPREKERRYNIMKEVVYRKTGEFWINSLARNLTQVHQEHSKREAVSIPRLNASQISESYSRSSNRLFFLDYEGTLASSSGLKNVNLSSTQRVIDTLNDLLQNKRNTVYVMSAQRPEELERLFTLVPDVGIIAENGCFVRKIESEEWIAMANLDEVAKWMGDVKEILKHYKNRVEGSVVEMRNCSLLFHYSKATDPEYAARQASECAAHINESCKSHRVHAVPLEKLVVIEPLDWSKESAATQIFEDTKIYGSPDFVFVAGDDRDDEGVFKWANGLGSGGVVTDVVTVSMGTRNTEALSTLPQGSSANKTTMESQAGKKRKDRSPSPAAGPSGTKRSKTKDSLENSNAAVHVSAPGGSTSLSTLERFQNKFLATTGPEHPLYREVLQSLIDYRVSLDYQRCVDVTVDLIYRDGGNAPRDMTRKPVEEEIGFKLARLMLPFLDQILMRSRLQHISSK
ncbi:alpha,alpha-trehalose phosphate synthase subunit [Tothia fuscella]|uniref:Alpha,alpha-trehalose phosphate synthase subunit n=1 Tax=Tothia fuscella TaxID=1048955 RepID=A0A9P4P1Z7_9PEZI|nr:alpha,alpha-trehalose phosphate synthase subunit [Tothia fuscella]